MGQRKTPSLTYGEYVSPDRDTSIEVSYARLEMIETAKRIYPRFLEKLASDVFPVYCEHTKGKPDFEKTLWGRHSPFERLEKQSPLKSVLSKWAVEFNVDCEWLLDDALRTLRGWRVASNDYDTLTWNARRGGAHHYVNGGPFELHSGGWEPELRSWFAYSKYIRERLKIELSKYEKKTRKLAESAGLVRARWKYSLDNLEWFVLYQFAGMSSKKVADQYGGQVADSTVLKGVKAAAELVGWDHLRRPKWNRNIR